MQSSADILARIDSAPMERGTNALFRDDNNRPINPARWDGVPVPVRPWIVEDWIPQGYVTALYGDGGMGKSLLAQQLLTACATDKPWLGIETTLCPALGLFCEDEEDELHRRQDSINAAYGLSWRDNGSMRLWPRVGDDNVLMAFSRDGKPERTPLWHQLRQEALDIGARLIVIDTAADTFGGDENNRQEVRQFVATALGGLARDTNGAVLLCAHPSRSGLADGSGTGGSTAWNNTVRSRMYLKRSAEDGDERLLTRQKGNYAKAGEQVTLVWDRGVFRPSVPAAGIVANLEASEDDRIFLDCLRAIGRQGRYVTDSRQSGPKIYAPKAFANMPQAKGRSLKALEAAMERLFNDEKIKVGDVGKGANGNRKQGLVIVGE